MVRSKSTYVDDLPPIMWKPCTTSDRNAHRGAGQKLEPGIERFTDDVDLLRSDPEMCDAFIPASQGDGYDP